MLEKITLEKSSEFLRLALPYMSRYSVPITPDNYAVWYDFVAGTNIPLKEAIESRINKDQSIDEEVTSDLFKRYVDPTNMSQIDSAQEVLRSLAESVKSSIDSANGEVCKYEESLKEYGSKLDENIDPESLKSLVLSLGQSTDRMSTGSQELQQHLEESRREVEDLREELEKSRAEAKTDVLTGLVNRRGFNDVIEKLRNEEGDVLHDACLLLCDIDKFKNFNDTYGHLLGDKVIKTVAEVLKAQVKGKDLPTRFGGEEFVVLLPSTDLTGAQAVAESIRRATERCRVVKPKTGEQINRVTISIGVTQIAQNEAINETIARADEALYLAKENGRNRVETLLPANQMKVVNQR